MDAFARRLNAQEVPTPIGGAGPGGPPGCASRRQRNLQHANGAETYYPRGTNLLGVIPVIVFDIREGQHLNKFLN